MRKTLLAGAGLLAIASSSSAFASTLAYWNFDTNSSSTQAPGIQVPHSGDDGIFDGSTPDLSGNGNDLSVWNAGGAGFQYRADHPTTTNATNAFSIKNSGGGPAAFNIDRNGGDSVAGDTPSILTTGNFAAFTVEASYKPEVGGNRTVIGRDARDVVTGNGELSAFYLKLNPDNSAAVSFTDVGGVFHTAQTAPGIADAYDFNFPDDNEGLTGAWMNMAGVSDGTFLTLYVNGVQVAQTDMTGSSTNTALATGTETDTGNDWYAGGWSVGRGLFNGGHADRAYGFIDEVRISDSAVPFNQLLQSVPEPATATMIVGAMGTLLRRRRA